MRPMSTEEALSAFGSRAAIADLLNISRQAVYQWGETVPELSAYKLREIQRRRHAARKGWDRRKSNDIKGG